MMRSTRFLAVDVGASSGRVVDAAFDRSTMTLREMHRFVTPSTRRGDRLHWDLEGIMAEIGEGVRRSVDVDGDAALSIGIDTWGVDYGLLDATGSLLGPPVHHRDLRTAGRAAQLDGEYLYERTGVIPQDINTLTQLLAEDPDRLRDASTLLFMPDLIAHRICGVAATDVSIASTSQLLRPDGAIAIDVLRRFGLPDLLPPIVPSGTALDVASESFARASGWQGTVTTVAGHDTACAVAAIPAVEPVAFISCGTWGLVGLALDRPVNTPEALRAGFTNEAGFGSHHLLRNASGMWLLNECIRDWGGSPREDAAPLARAAEACAAFVSVIDPLDAVFLAPGNMPARIAEYCASHDQPVPQSRAEFVRCILDSLALGFAAAIVDVSDLTGVDPVRVHIVGGGSQIPSLCSSVASLLGVPVVAGPAEASVLGNAVIQSLAHGVISDRGEAVAVLAASARTETYQPSTDPLARTALETYRRSAHASAAAP